MVLAAPRLWAEAGPPQRRVARQTVLQHRAGVLARPAGIKPRPRSHCPEFLQSSPQRSVKQTGPEWEVPSCTFYWAVSPAIANSVRVPGVGARPAAYPTLRRDGSSTEVWTAQQLREALPWDRAPHYLLRDRDQNFGKDFVDQVKPWDQTGVLGAAVSVAKGLRRTAHTAEGNVVEIREVVVFTIITNAGLRNTIHHTLASDRVPEMIRWIR